MLDAVDAARGRFLRLLCTSVALLSISVDVLVCSSATMYCLFTSLCARAQSSRLLRPLLARLRLVTSSSNPSQPLYAAANCPLARSHWHLGRAELPSSTLPAAYSIILKSLLRAGFCRLQTPAMSKSKIDSGV
jgi:hypothetical protein